MQKLAWTLGILTAVDANLTPHANSYNLLEVQARAYAGITTAMSYTYQPLYSMTIYWRFIFRSRVKIDFSKIL